MLSHIQSYSIRWNCLILKGIFYNFAHKGLFLGGVALQPKSCTLIYTGRGLKLIQSINYTNSITSTAYMHASQWPHAFTGSPLPLASSYLQLTEKEHKTHSLPKGSIILPRLKMKFPSEITPSVHRGTIGHDFDPDFEKSWGSLLANANHRAVPVK